jgi:predicted GIY-YIG superfamily endonuclease
MSVSVYDLNHHLSGRREVPGVARATIKTEFVSPAHRTAHRVAHRPALAVVADVRCRRGGGSRVQLAASFICGSSSENVTPVIDANAGDFRLCRKCERLSSRNPERWTIYLYEDAEGQPLYVGQTVDLEMRHRQHATDPISRGWYRLAADLYVLEVLDSRRDALAAERRWIHQVEPRCNIQHNLKLARRSA